MVRSILEACLAAAVGASASLVAAKSLGFITISDRKFLSEVSENGGNSDESNKTKIRQQTPVTERTDNITLSATSSALMFP